MVGRRARVPNHAICFLCMRPPQVAKFVSFVAGSFAALLLGLSFLDENLLEVPMAGRNLVWWLALTGILLTIRCVGRQ